MGATNFYWAKLSQGFCYLSFLKAVTIRVIQFRVPLVRKMRNRVNSRDTAA
jgi:hypothetical protein